ncbi:hypothetical protein [Lyngbya sp. CCY1209]|uniref:hypothetical protein n=1 Tax=Lyngbya sp. CCY1209 TaxID=2886103 RepID=UPI002D1FF4C6|nr:hypothetical protein [Lyngbya sp. CCY1209]MEB3883397.1 hypothetical protein [Lyngbya sp. CCY1209]
MKSNSSHPSKLQKSGVNYGRTFIPPYSHRQRPYFSISSSHRVERVETPDQRRHREVQAEAIATQKKHLRDRLCQRLLKAQQRGDTRLVRELRKEWEELFPDTPSII